MFLLTYLIFSKANSSSQLYGYVQTVLNFYLSHFPARFVEIVNIDNMSEDYTEAGETM